MEQTMIKKKQGTLEKQRINYQKTEMTSTCLHLETAF